MAGRGVTNEGRTPAARQGVAGALTEGYDMNTSEVLYTAADLIEQRGWGTGSWNLVAGPLCIEGGIAAAMGVEVELEAVSYRCPAYQAVRAYVGEIPFLWNDNLLHRRTLELINEGPVDRPLEDKKAQALAEGQAKVIEVLRATAVIEAARESEVAQVSA